MENNPFWSTLLFHPSPKHHRNSEWVCISTATNTVSAASCQLTYTKFYPILIPSFHIATPAFPNTSPGPFSFKKTHANQQNRSKLRWTTSSHWQHMCCKHTQHNQIDYFPTPLKSSQLQFLQMSESIEQEPRPRFTFPLSSVLLAVCFRILLCCVHLQYVCLLGWVLRFCLHFLISGLVDVYLHVFT